MDWARILAYVTGTVDQELLRRNEYLAVENRILKAQLQGRLKLSDAERATLGEIGHQLGRKVLAQVATVAPPDTILPWYRKLVARKFDGSEARRGPGRPLSLLKIVLTAVGWVRAGASGLPQAARRS
jgi:putative transposase